MKMEVYVVRGRHGELFVSNDELKAFDFWAETNGFTGWLDFFDEYEDEFEFSEGHWFLDECGEVNLVEVR